MKIYCYPSPYGPNDTFFSRALTSQEIKEIELLMYGKEISGRLYGNQPAETESAYNEKNKISQITGN